jgi:hypothetical protein
MIRNLSILLVCLSYAACAQIVGPKASAQQMDYDFGNIPQGKVVTHNFVLVNNGGDVLKITDVHASCGCTAANPDKSELAPGESTNIKVDFNSSGKSGKQEKWVYVKTNDPANPELKFKFTGNVLDLTEVKNDPKSPKLYFPESSHDFGSVVSGKVVDYTFKFKNNGKEALVIKDVKTSCGCTAALVSSKRLLPGQEGTLHVELDTQNREGKMSRNISIESNDPEEPIKVILIFADINKEKK